ncbi:MAG: GAF domain-containing protein, partial [Anaerolineae bacterium]|nr:GAF domain-containing protein [Anaerolineae bacterium]
MNNALRVLILEDRLADAELMVYELRRTGFAPEWIRVETEAEYIRALQDAAQSGRKFDVILADYVLPQFNALTALRLLKEYELDIPFIVVTGSVGEEAAVECMRAGAADYLLKDRLTRLGVAVENALENQRLREEKRHAEAALRESEQKYRLMVERSLQGLVIFQDGRIVFANQAMADILGYHTAGELLALSPEEVAALAHPEDRALVLGRIRERLEGKNPPTHYEFRALRKDGMVCWVAVASSLIEYRGRPAVQVAAVDITERKRAEEMLQQRVAQLTMLNRVGREITASLDTSKLIEMIPPLVYEVFGYSYVGLSLLDQASGKMVLRSAAGKLPPPFPREFKWTEGISPAGSQGDARLLSVVEAGSLLGAQLAIPIQVGSAVIGMLHVGSDKPNGFDKSDVTALEALADQVAIALENARLFAEVKRRTEELTALNEAIRATTSSLELENVLSTCTQRACAVLQAEACSIMLLREDGTLEFLAAVGSGAEGLKGKQLPPGTGVAGWVAQNGLPAVVSDVRQDPRFYPGLDAETGFTTRSILAVPLYSKGEVIGVMEVLNRVDGTFRPNDVQLLESLAAAAAIAIENARLYTNTKLAEDNLRAERALLRTIIDLIPENVYVKDTGCRKTLANLADLKYLGVRTEAEALGKTDFDFYPPDIASHFWEDDQFVLRTGKPVLNREEMIVSPEGETRWLLTSKVPLRDSDGRITGLVGVGRDITERKRAEEELKHYAERLATLRALDQAIIAAWSKEAIARAAVHLLHRLIPCYRACIFLLDQEERRISLLATAGKYEPLEPTTLPHLPVERASGRISLTTALQVVEVLSPDHSPCPWADYCSLQPAGPHAYILAPLVIEGEAIGMLSIELEDNASTPEYTDIAREIADSVAIGLRQASLREQLERQVAELEQRVAERTAELSLANAELARAVRAKDEFLAAMSHELRTPLNSIIGLSEALQEDVYGPLNDRQLRSITIIGESGKHLLALINDILDVSKIEAGKLELTIGPVAVEPVCQASLGIVKQAAQKKRHTLSLTLDERVKTIQADSRRLKQILVNLLDNAVKFTPEGGAIGLEVRADEEREAVHFTVWDTGIGISAENMSRLFKPFVQLDSRLSREYSGTGLGLVLVQRMAELHGGSVTVESEVGKGSRFTVSLPWRFARAEVAEEEAEVREGEMEATVQVTCPTQVRILLAEDNEDSIYLISDY